MAPITGVFAQPSVSSVPVERFGDGYVSPQVCAGCHADVYRTYRESGMARSFSPANQENTIGKSTGKIRYYHQPSRTFYSMFQRGGEYYQRRWRIGFDGKETDVDESRIDFVMGSGNHARAYLHRNENGSLVELPLAWYADKNGSWALNPGYDTNHVIAPRRIGYDCMFCHNSYPQIPSGYEHLNREPVYLAPMPEGIDCQRCHGPGERHVAAARAAHARPDDLRKTIFNPTKVSGERQMEVCMQCHLQSTSSRLPAALVRFDRGPFSYRAGESLGDFIVNFDREAAQRGDQFGIVDSAYRLRQSQCWIHSQGRLTCLTCHDPHRRLSLQDAHDHYNAVCRQCHSSQLDQTVKAGTHSPATNCIDCHMPKRRTDDVVHVVMTDHYIQVRKPMRNLLGELQERHEAQQDAYRGEVIPYYPNPFPKTDEDRLYIAYAQVANDSNVRQGVEQLAEEIERQKPKQAEFYFALAEAWRDAGMASRAAFLYEEAAKRDPEPGWILKRLGDALWASGNLPGAVSAMERAAREWSDDGRIQYSLGALAMLAGRKEEAIAALKKALALDSYLPYAHNSLGRAFLGTGRIAAAEEEFRSELRIQPDFADAQVNLATTLSARNNFAEAAYYFQSALALNPANAVARYKFAATLMKLHRLGEAQNEAERAIITNPNLPMTHQVLGEVLAEEGQFREAINAYEEALRIGPDSDSTHLDLGVALSKQGKRNRAIEELREAASASDPVIRRAAAQALQHMGEHLGEQLGEHR